MHYVRNNQEQRRRNKESARRIRETALQTPWADSPVFLAASMGRRPSTRTSLAASWDLPARILIRRARAVNRLIVIVSNFFDLLTSSGLKAWNSYGAKARH